MININKTDSFIKQQNDCLDILTELIAFDKEHGTPPENSKVLEAFIDTQKRALNMASKLLEKHKPALEAAEKAEQEKRKAQAKIEAAKRKEEDKKAQVIKDLKAAQNDENSLFACTLDEAADETGEDDEPVDEYAFEENDED